MTIHRFARERWAAVGVNRRLAAEPRQVSAPLHARGQPPASRRQTWGGSSWGIQVFLLLAVIALVFGSILYMPPTTSEARTSNGPSGFGSRHIPDYTANPLFSRSTVCPASTGLSCGATRARGDPLPTVSPDLPDWTNRTTTQSPSPRAAAALAYDEEDQVLILFGGQGRSVLSFFGDTWTYHQGSWTNLSIAGPPARAGASMAYDRACGCTLLFGGAANKVVGTSLQSVLYNDTWMFSNGHWSNLNLSHSPPSQADASMAYDAVDGYSLLYGVADPNASTYIGSTWKFYHGSWTEVTGVSPPGRIGSGMAFDGATRTVVLFGGVDGSHYFNDTWEYVGGAWSRVVSSAPPATAFGALAYDPQGGYLVLAGGTTGTDQNQTWFFHNRVWTSIPIHGSPPRDSAAGAAGPADGMVVFGGHEIGNPPGTVGVYGDTWSLTTPFVQGIPTITLSPGSACLSGNPECPAGSTVVNITLTFAVRLASAPGTNPPPGAVPTWVDAPGFSFVPWGDEFFLPNGVPRVQCGVASGVLPDCDLSTTRFTVAQGVAGLAWDFSRTLAMDEMTPGAWWSATFPVEFGGPGQGRYPADACGSPACAAGGSTPRDGWFTEAAFLEPFGENRSNDSFPLGFVSLIDPPLPGSTQPPPSSPTTAPPPTTVPAPPTAHPVIAPPLSSPGLVLAAHTTSGFSIYAAAAGILSAGLARAILSPAIKTSQQLALKNKLSSHHSPTRRVP